MSLHSPPTPSTIAALGLVPTFSAVTTPSGPALPPSAAAIPSKAPLVFSTAITCAVVSLPSIATSTVISGIPTLPSKLAQKIIFWEYITSGTAVSSSVVILPKSSYNTHCHKKRQIADTVTWVQVFSSYILVLGTRYPDTLPELISYQLLILQHSQKFQYSSWLCYDMDFQTWAAQTGTQTWFQINPQCYALAINSQGSSSQ